MVLQGLFASVAMTLPGMALAKMDRLLEQHYGDREIQHQWLKLKLPTLAENGNSVPLNVWADEGAPGFTNLKIYAPENPEPLLVEFDLYSAKTLQMNTRIRLANSQTVMAVAMTSVRELFAASAKTVITLAACVEPLL